MKTSTQVDILLFLTLFKTFPAQRLYHGLTTMLLTWRTEFRMCSLRELFMSKSCVCSICFSSRCFSKASFCCCLSSWRSQERKRSKAGEKILNLHLCPHLQPHITAYNWKWNSPFSSRSHRICSVTKTHHRTKSNQHGKIQSTIDWLRNHFTLAGVTHSTFQASSMPSRQSEFCLPLSLSRTGRRYCDGGQYSIPNSAKPWSKMTC